MNSNHAAQVVRRSWLLIVIMAILGLGASVLYIRNAPAEYTAQSVVYVSASGSGNVAELNASSTLSTQQAKNFAIIATKERVINKVIARLGLDQTPAEVARSVTATVPASSSVVTIEVVESSPEAAATVANAFADSLRDVANELLPPIRRGAPGIQVQTVQVADPPAKASSPQVIPVVAAGIGLGIVLGLLIAFLVDAARQGRAERQAASAEAERQAASTE